MNLHALTLSTFLAPRKNQDRSHGLPVRASSFPNVANRNSASRWMGLQVRWTSSRTLILTLLAATLTILPAHVRGQHWCEEDPILASQYQALTTGATSCVLMGQPDDPARRNAFIPTGATPVKVVRLKFHVFTQDDGSDPATTTTAIERQMSALNAHYLPVRIQFKHTVAIIKSSRFRVLDLGLVEDVEMKDAYADQAANQHNVYVVSLSGGLLGRSTFPWWPSATGKQGGTLIDGSAVSSRPSVLTHELGHALGLWHTHHGVSEVGSCSSCWERADGTNADQTGDFCSDTPPTPVNYSCTPPTGADGCSNRSWGRTALENFMGYSLDCHSQFTPQQAGRMHAWIEEKLLGWLDAPVVSPPATIYVDRSYQGRNPDGSPSAPFPNVQQGFTAARNGDVLRIRHGNYGVSALLAGRAVRLEAENGPVILSRASEPPIPTLVADAGADAEITSGASATLLGSAQSINTSPATTWHWEKVSGPGRVFSKNYDSAKFEFWVSASGPYELRLIAGNGQLVDSDTVIVTFREPVLYVDAGRNQEVPFPWTASLAGSLLVDEHPNPEVTFRWRPSRRGALTFTSPTSLATGVVASQRGVYYIYLDSWYRGKYKVGRVTLAFGVPLPCCSVGDANEEESMLEPLLEISSDPSGAVRLTVLSPDSRPCMIQRSGNLRDWADWHSVDPVDGTFSLLDRETSGLRNEFYRLRVQ